MANPLYDMIMRNTSSQSPSAPAFQNPMQKASYILQALRDPRAFVKNAFPDIPDSISNDPNQILQYLQKTRNISNDQISNLLNMYPRF